MAAGLFDAQLTPTGLFDTEFNAGDLFSSEFITTGSSGAISATINGTSSLTSSVTGIGVLALSINGASTVAAGLSGKGVLAVLVNGSAVLSVSLTGKGALSSAINGASTVSGIATGQGALASSVSGASSLSSSLTGSGAVLSAISGNSVVIGSLAGFGSLVSDISGAGILTSTLAGTGNISSSITGTSVVTATTGSGSFSSSIQGTSVVSGVLSGLTDLSSTIQGIGTTSAVLVGSGILSGAIQGSSSVIATTSGGVPGNLKATLFGGSLIYVMAVNARTPYTSSLSGSMASSFGASYAKPSLVQTSSNQMQTFYSGTNKYLGAVGGQNLLGKKQKYVAGGDVIVPSSGVQTGVNFTLMIKGFDSGQRPGIAIKDDVFAIMPSPQVLLPGTTTPWALICTAQYVLPMIDDAPQYGNQLLVSWNLRIGQNSYSGSALSYNNISLRPALQLSLGVQFSGSVDASDYFQASLYQFDTQF